MAPSGVLESYSIGIGDRFGREGEAQLQALSLALTSGVAVTPVWNKSNREHTIIGSTPADTRHAVEAAVARAGWRHPYYVDADHINLKSVEGFLSTCDFFTIDVADYIGRQAEASEVAGFRDATKKFLGRVPVPGLAAPLDVTEADIETIAGKYLWPVKEAGRISRRIGEGKGGASYVTEVSFDEASLPQTPKELFFILAAIAQEGIPIQTVAPKFSGKFLKGIDYVGSRELFAREFAEDLRVIAFAVRTFGLPANLKISVHSGSDKFSLYPIIRAAMKEQGAGIHLKTAGTTWLEELIGLASAEGSGLAIAKSIYSRAHGRIDELCKPYETVIEIDRSKLPSPGNVDRYSGTEFAAALRHDPSHPAYNLHFRQLLHVSFRVAAEMGGEYLDALEKNRDAVARNVTENLWKRHIGPLFVGQNFGQPRG